MGVYGAYELYDGFYIFSKQNHLIFRTFPKMLVGSCCNFCRINIGFAWKSVV